jgi:hypothetical protein
MEFAGPWRGVSSSPGPELLGASPPMSPSENPTSDRRRQVVARRGGSARRCPLPRRCLLKGCEQRFRPQHAQQRERRKRDLGWVRAEPLVDLATAWLEQNPGMSKRQLAIRLSARIREMGYSRSHDTLQPILGGCKKKTRRFVYRAMLIECPSVKCLTKSCVYPAVREGLCRVCLLRKYDPVHFRGRSALG